MPNLTSVFFESIAFHKLELYRHQPYIINKSTCGHGTYQYHRWSYCRLPLQYSSSYNSTKVHWSTCFMCTFFSCFKMLNALNFANVILIDVCIQSRIISCLQISDNFQLTRLWNSAISMKFCLQFFNENNVTSLSKGSQTRNMILHGIFTFTVISFNQNTIVPGFNCFE